jgi:hypothetical protein
MAHLELNLVGAQTKHTCLCPTSTRVSAKSRLARSSGLRRSKTSHGAIALYQAPEQFTDGIAEAPLVHEPGTTSEYSLAVDVLGRAIEAVSGQPLSVFLDERLFRPHRIRGRHAIIVIPSLLDRPWDMPSFRQDSVRQVLHQSSRDGPDQRSTRRRSGQ